MFEVKNIETLLQPHIGEKSVVKYETKHLTAPGENYGSLILALDVTVKAQNGEEEILHLVAKQLPENPLIQKLFHVNITFNKELSTYSTMLPTFNGFLQEQGLKQFDSFPKFFGGRLSLDETATKPDADAVILLENLKFANYEIMDRTLGFNLEQAELILKDLAVFHALPIALKLKKPDLFEEKIKPSIKQFKMSKEKPEWEQQIKNTVCDVCKASGTWDKYSGKITALLDESSKLFEPNDSGKDHPFWTITHCDAWVNNLMLKIVDGKAVKNKLIDFQIIQESLLGNDVIFFIYSSVQPPIIEQSIDYLFDFYFNKFVEALKELNCDTSAYTSAAFHDNLNKSAKRQIWHTLFMFQPIYSEDVKELKDLDADDIFKAKSISNKCKEKCKTIIVDADSRNWL